MPVTKTPRAIIEVFGAQVNGQYPITGYEIEMFLTWEGEGSEHFTPKVVREPASAEEVQALRGASEETLTGQLQEFNWINSMLQLQVVDLKSRLQGAVLALQAVAQADTNWDESPRAQVAKVLQDNQ